MIDQMRLLPLILFSTSMSSMQTKHADKNSGRRISIDDHVPGETPFLFAADKFCIIFS